MVQGDLDTTNLLLGIMAAVSVIEALALVAAGVMGWKLYARTMQTVKELDERRVAPLVAKVDALMVNVDSILHDVKGITSRINSQTERVNTAISTTMDRVDQTADRVRSSVNSRVQRVTGVVNGVMSVLGTLFNGRSRRYEAQS
jgi:uncharacterized protein YoxC